MKNAIVVCLLFASNFAQAKPKVDPTLIGGQIAKRGHYPEVVYISAGRSRCSATIVGERTLLTAAHCIKDGGEVWPAEFVVDQEVFKAKCDHHPDYDNDYTYDYALCKISKDLKPKKYGIIAKAGPEMNEKVLLMGYGCTDPRNENGEGGGTGGNDGKLRYGAAEVTMLPYDSNAHFHTVGESALCFGDSGGPAMEYMKNPEDSEHYVLGVNSMGDIRVRSLISSTYLDGFRSWAKAWAVAEKTEICGINADCRAKNPPQFPGLCLRSKFKVKWYTWKLEKWQKRLDKCEGRP